MPVSLSFRGEAGRGWGGGMVVIYEKWPRLQDRSNCGRRMLSFIGRALFSMLRAGTLLNMENSGH